MIKITDKYFLDADTHCFMLREKTINKDKKSKNFGKEDYNILGCYVSIESALKGLVKSELRKFVGKNKIQEIEDLTKKIDELNLFFSKKIKEVK